MAICRASPTGFSDADWVGPAAQFDRFGHSRGLPRLPFAKATAYIWFAAMWWSGHLH
jgi:hypothetical protein